MRRRPFRVFNRHAMTGAATGHSRQQTDPLLSLASQGFEFSLSCFLLSSLCGRCERHRRTECVEKEKNVALPLLGRGPPRTSSLRRMDAGDYLGWSPKEVTRCRCVGFDMPLYCLNAKLTTCMHVRPMCISGDYGLALNQSSSYILLLLILQIGFTATVGMTKTPLKA